MTDVIATVAEHRDELERLAERDDLRTAKYARALLAAVDVDAPTDPEVGD